MFLNRRGFLAVVAIASAIFATSFVNRDAIADGGRKEPRLEGNLVSIVNRDVKIRLRNGAERTITVPVTAKVERNGVRVPLTAFKVNDRVQARFTANGATVIKFEGVGP